MAMTAIHSGTGEAELDLTFATPAAARVAADALRERAVLLAGLQAEVRIRPSAFIEAVGGDAERIEMVVSAATDAEADALAARVDEGDERSRTSVAIDDPALRAKPALVVRWDERRLAANGIARDAAERDVRAALGDHRRRPGRISAARSRDPAASVLPRELGVVPVRIASDRVVPLAGVAGARIGERTPIAVHDQGRPARRLAFFDRPRRRMPALAGAHGSERVRFAGHARELSDAFAQMSLAG